MTHADPWDEITRLEEEMEAELLAHREAPRPSLPDLGERVERSSLAASEG
jgi:hypothetical protein